MLSKIYRWIDTNHDEVLNLVYIYEHQKHDEHLKI